MTVTLGYRDPVTARDFVIEVGESRDEEQGGYWAIEYNPETGESSGGIFFAADADISAHGTPNARTEWHKVAEAARAAHHIAAGEFGGGAYDRSQEAFKAAIHAAYPTLDKCGVYGVWLDCMESVEYCAKTLSKLSRDDQRKYIAMGGGFDS
jgi:hypothetical protein